ncbi:MAG: thioesterase family protein [Hyphomicrobiaceae bacterium]|nr:thioesterase family protein [Hyphomicrobiaceae bacterium]
MNLWLRLAWVFLSSLWRPALDPRTGVSSVRFRVWPHDLDLNLHMNNGRYLTIMDLGRIDFVLRTGLWRPLWRESWSPIIGAAAIRFRRELRPFERFHVVTRLVAWSETSAVMEQTFLTEGRRVAARALIKAGFYARADRAYVTVRRVVEALGATPQEAEGPPLTPEVEAFLKADSALRKPSESN